MFVRRKNNRSGTISVHLIDKSDGGYTIVKSFGTAKTVEEAELLESKARLYLKELSGLSQSLFEGPTKDSVEEVDESTIENKEVLFMGPELFFGELYRRRGLSSVSDDMFRHLVLSRLYVGGSKAKTSAYLKSSQGKDVSVPQVYEAVDAIAPETFEKVVKIASSNPGNAKCYYVISPMPITASDTTIRLAKKASKSSKKSPSKTYVGVLMLFDGTPISYDVIGAKMVKSARVLSLAEKAASNAGLSKPTIVTDSAILSKATVKTIKEKNIGYILSEKVSSLNDEVLSTITEKISSSIVQLRNDDGTQIVAIKSESQAIKDAALREEGLLRLQKKIDAGTLKSITGRGYSKLLSKTDDGAIIVDDKKVEEAKSMDGILACSTNASLDKSMVVRLFSNVEKMSEVFQISKTDFVIRPSSGKLKDRIESHALVCFASLMVMKQLEDALSGSLFSFTYEEVKSLCTGV
ncbi:MAG: hypothetical protein MJZ16_04755 [Bacteroidales bacterium]|nr:hypothetical protein [Bacteroidales bacterium]